MRLKLEDLPPNLQNQVAAQFYPKAGVKYPHPSVGTNPPEKPRLKQKKGGLNKTEQEFLGYLNEHKIFAFSQSFTFTIANGCRYTPDFFRFGPDGGEAWEVKGFMRDDAAVKIKVAARLFPKVKFWLVSKKNRKQGGGWQFQLIEP